MPLIKKQHGFAMVEVLVTAVILAIGVSGLGMLLLRSIQGTQDSSQLSQGMWMVHDFAGRIKANAPGARQSGYVIEDGSYDCESNKTDNQCADIYVPGIGIKEGELVDATECTAGEMANHDRWTTLCSVSQESLTYSSPSDFMVNPELTSRCSNKHATRSSDPVSGQLDCIQYAVTLSWDTKRLKGDDDEDNRIRKNSYSITVELN